MCRDREGLMWSSCVALTRCLEGCGFRASPLLENGRKGTFPPQRGPCVDAGGGLFPNVKDCEDPLWGSKQSPPGGLG